MKYSLALVVALLLNATANLVIKFGMKQIAEGGGVLARGVLAGLVSVLTNPLLVVGIFCFGLNLLFYMYALQKLPLSVAYPVMVTTGFAIIVTVAGLRLRERLTLAQWAGVGLILVGVWLVASQAERQVGTPPPATREATARLIGAETPPDG